MLHFHNLTLGYARHPVVHHLQGHIPTGSLLAVIGPNGGGKSTLLHAIAGFERPSSGSLSFDGMDLLPLKPNLPVSLPLPSSSATPASSRRDRIRSLRRIMNSHQ
mgnify:CR=1 FL=1